VRPEAKRGPTPILPPALALPHTESASITGGYVYRGKRLKELEGVYICGDWVTRKIWGTRFDGDKIVWHKELAIGKEKIVAFGEDHDKELYFVHHDDNGSIYRLVPNEAVKTYRADFPKKLSETGLFTSVESHSHAAGVLPFSINAERWADHATAQRFVAIPGTGTIKIYDSRLPWPDYNGEIHFPKDGVLAKTLTLEMERGNPQTRRRVETQVLHFDGVEWKGYTYAWNDQQTDATLVPAAGMDRTLTVIDAKAPGKKREQRWHYPSRTECLMCHNPWAGYTLAFNVPQLNRTHDFGYMVVTPQLPMHQRMDLVRFVQRVKGSEKTQTAIPTQRIPNLGSATTSLDDRARAYLHVNCAHCHQFGGGGTANIDLRYSNKLEQTNLVDVRPVQGTFEIAGAQLLSPGDPYRSVLYYRMAKLGPGRMPHIGSEVVDEAGLRLIHEWIRSIHPRKDERVMMDKLRSARPAERSKLIGQLLASTSSAMMLANAIGENQASDELRADVLKAALAVSNSQVRDLFERFVPEDQRTKRLGSAIKPAQILERKGNADRGRELFFKSAGLQCANCHRINGNGSTLGPDLSDIGKQKTRTQILESILEPSKFVDPKYVTYLVETNDGKVLTGLLASKNDKEIVLKMAGDKEARVPASHVATLAPQQKSLMPELLLRDVTLEQAADLLEFLAGLK
jgi:putative heme-binding domain-containing protein